MGYVWDLVDVDLDEVDGGEFVGHPVKTILAWALVKIGYGDVLNDGRSNDLAGTAPSRECVHDYDLVVGEDLVEIGLAVFNALASLVQPSTL